MPRLPSNRLKTQLSSTFSNARLPRSLCSCVPLLYSALRPYLFCPFAWACSWHKHLPLPSANPQPPLSSRSQFCSLAPLVAPPAYMPGGLLHIRAPLTRCRATLAAHPSSATGPGVKRHRRQARPPVPLALPGGAQQPREVADGGLGQRHRHVEPLAQLHAASGAGRARICASGARAAPAARAAPPRPLCAARAPSWGRRLGPARAAGRSAPWGWRHQTAPRRSRSRRCRW